jgi:hypothetical protein
VTPVPVIALSMLVRLPSGYDSARRAPREAQSQNGGSKSDGLGMIVQSNTRFWLIATAIFTLSIATFGVISRIVLIVAVRGQSSVVAAGMRSTIRLGSPAARLCAGYAADRIFAPM